MESWSHSPHERRALETIRALGLESQVIFNKGAVMMLPAGVNKASGLLAALGDLELSPHNVVGVGDAENDRAFLRICGCAATVANALPTIASTADIRLTRSRGAAVEALFLAICEKDHYLASRRSGLAFGTDAESDDAMRLGSKSPAVWTNSARRRLSELPSVGLSAILGAGSDEADKARGRLARFRLVDAKRSDVACPSGARRPSP